MRPIVWVLAILLAALVAACGAESAAAPRPNVILLVMDVARGDRVSLNGYPRQTTPYLESLGRESTVYTNAWSPSCWTGPAHASLFTGLRPEHHGFLMGMRFYLDERAVTLAERLQAAGYATLFLSCNPVVSRDMGLAQGFRVVENIPEAEGDEPVASCRATERALELVQHCRDQGRPFFLFLNDWEPHLAYDPPEEIAERFLPADSRPEEVAEARAFTGGTEALLGEVARRFTARQWEILSALYDAEIASLDAEIERFVEGLRNLNVLEDTILVITSDHGENLGEKGRCAHFMSLARTVLHIPLLVRYPPRFPAGERSDSVVRLEDVFPTLLSLCGVASPPGLDGLSLLEDEGARPARAILGGQVNDAVKRDYPDFVRSQAWRPLRSVFDGRLHLIQRNDGHEELYDLVSDPKEEKNVASEHAELLPGLRSLLPSSPDFH